MAARRKAAKAKTSPHRTRTTRAKGGNLKPATKGEVRNPKGENGWTKARRRVAEIIAANAEGITAKSVEQALAGDDKAARLLLGPLLPAQKHEVEHSGEVSFTWKDE